MTTPGDPGHGFGDNLSPIQQAFRRGVGKQAVDAAEATARAGYERAQRLERVRAEAAEFVAALTVDSGLAHLLPEVVWTPVEMVWRTASWQQHTDFACWNPEKWIPEDDPRSGQPPTPGYPGPRADGFALLPEGTDAAVAVVVAASPYETADVHVAQFTNIGSIAFHMGWRSLGVVTSRDEFDCAVANAPQAVQMTREQAYEHEQRRAVSAALDDVLRRPEFGGSASQ